MTEDEVKLVQDSFKKVVPIVDTAADIFYDRLFETHPEVRSMFPADMKGQKKALMGTLAVAVNSLHEVEKIIPVVQDLGVKHVAYGVKDEHYPIVGETLLYTLEKGLGDDFTPDVKDAWTKTYTTVSTVMMDAANEAIAKKEPEKKGFFSKLFGG